MHTDTLSPKVAAATLPPGGLHAGNRNLGPGPKRMAVPKGWGSPMRGARKDGAARGFVATHRVPHVAAQSILGQTDSRECVPFLTNRENVS